MRTAHVLAVAAVLAGPLSTLGLRACAPDDPDAGVVSVALGVVIAAVSIPIVAVQLHRDRLAHQHPGQPWKHRSDWSRGVVTSGGSAARWFLAAVTAVVALALAGMVGVVCAEEGLVAAAGLSGFGALIVPLLVGYAWSVGPLRDASLHFGESRLGPGRRFRATVRGALPAGPATVALECRAVHHRYRSVAVTLVERWELGTVAVAAPDEPVPIDFVAPSGPATDSLHDGGTVGWVLHVRGCDGSFAEFGVPYFP